MVTKEEKNTLKHFGLNYYVWKYTAPAGFLLLVTEMFIDNNKNMWIISIVLLLLFYGMMKYFEVARIIEGKQL